MKTLMKAHSANKDALRRTSLCVLLAAALLTMLAPPAGVSALSSIGEAYMVSSATLIEQARYLDGRTVSYQGEAIGDIMRRDGHAWINVSDGGNAIGIWLNEAQSAGLAYVGRYNAQGDLVQVQGTFNRACSEHGGDYDIHALSVMRLAAGHPVGHSAGAGQMMVAIAAFGAAAAALFLYGRSGMLARRLVRRQKPGGIRRPLP